MLFLIFLRSAKLPIIQFLLRITKNISEKMFLAADAENRGYGIYTSKKMLIKGLSVHLCIVLCIATVANPKHRYTSKCR